MSGGIIKAPGADAVVDASRLTATLGGHWHGRYGAAPYQVMPDLSADDFAALGHNSARELVLIASDARHGLELVSAGEGKAIDGWLIYGAALNAGREKFPSDEQFGQWVRNHQLGGHDLDRAAAMWAAGSPAEFAEAQQLGSARTVRGIHAKWKEEQHRLAAEEAKRQAKEAATVAKAAEKEAAVAEEKAKAEKDEAARIEAEKIAEEKREAAEKAKAEAAEKKKAAKKAGGPFVENNSGENEWYTPKHIIDAVHLVLGGIDLDPASSEIANKTVQAAKFFTEDDNGLEQEWPEGRVFMNPPYAQPLMAQFSDKYCQHMLRETWRETCSGIVLVNNATETGWFHQIASVSSAICFPKGRIRFVDTDGIAGGAPLQGQAILYSGHSSDVFLAAFSEFGVVFSNG